MILFKTIAKLFRYRKIENLTKMELELNQALKKNLEFKSDNYVLMEAVVEDCKAIVDQLKVIQDKKKKLLFKIR